MFEGDYTIQIAGESVDVTVTEYIPEDPQVIGSTPETSYEGEPENIQYKANEENSKFNYFLDEVVFVHYDEIICKQLSEIINENSIYFPC